jgi:SAM-dependent methyltransferase
MVIRMGSFASLGDAGGRVRAWRGEPVDTRKLWNANALAWTELSRAGFDVYRDLVNTPAFFALLPPVDGLLCLDLGCGEGHNTRLLAGQGARVVALDIANSLLAAAAAAGMNGIRYLVGDGVTLPFGDSTFVAAGLTLEAIAEPHADDVTATAHPEVADTRIAPYFLVLRARKPVPPSAATGHRNPGCL